MRVELLYGRQGLSVRLPEGAAPTVIEKPAMPLCPDPERSVAQALEAGMGEGGFRSAVRRGRSVCILICDITRPVPNGLFLRPLIERLLGDGIARDRITLMVATGLHRPNLGAELAELVADDWVLANVSIVNHDARDDAMHVDLGRTPRGTVVRLDRRLVDADIRIVTGLVEPHFMAGYSGGRKVIAPGIAHAETITTFHNHAFMSDPRATNCILEGNPLHEEQLAILRMLGRAYALNTVIDDQRRLAFVNFGEIVESHLEAVAFVDGYTRVEVDRPFKTVVTTSAGYPLDRTYYQTVKGMSGATRILAKGGDLIIASECAEGLGSDHFIAAQRRYLEQGPEGFLSSIARNAHAEIDEWQTQKQAESDRCGTMSLYAGGLNAEQRALTGARCIDSIELAVARSIERHADSRIAVIPEGPYVVPVVGASTPAV